MRIAFVPAARVLSEDEPNGESLIAVSLMRELARRGHSILAYCERSDLKTDDIEVRQIDPHGATAGMSRINFTRRIARDASNEKFDIAHVLFPFNTSDGHSAVRGAPTVCGPLNLPWPASIARPASVRARVGNTFTDALERRMHARTLARAAKLLVIGDSARAAIPPNMRDKCADIPFGLDLSRFPRQPLPAEPVILFLSVLQERKGIDVLLRALPLVQQRVPRAKLIVAGADPNGMQPRLEQEATALGITNGLEFAGPIAHHDVAQMYARASVFCQPSFGEPFGMTVIEAMASGRAVVATRAGGIPDAIIDGVGGRLMPAGDHHTLASALIDVIEHREHAEEMGAFNRARAEEKYALNIVVDQIERVYHDVAGGAHVAAA